MAYPSSLWSPTTKSDDTDDVLASHINDAQTEIVAVETELGTDVAGSQTDLKTRLARSLDDNGNLVMNDSTSQTISSGAVTISQNFHRIDTESSAASDDLDTINGGTDGYILFIRPANDARTVVVKHNTGNIYSVSGTDVTLDDEYDILQMVYDSNLTKWLALR
jgi:hypothetical protein